MSLLKYASIFTIPNDELISDGSVDPMGMQMIWTYFGQLIYKNKLTTVSTDIRNYTINLLHHYVLYKFEHEKALEFNNAQSHFPYYNDAYSTKAGMLIFMEDILVYSLIDQSASVDTEGLLGSYKAQNELAKAKNDFSTIEIHAERSKGVLVRQIQLGINGRYKGPFINMELMTTNFVYYKEFERVEQLIKQWPEGTKLVNKLMDLLVDLLQVDTKDYPIVTLERYKNDAELWQLYVDCFGKLELNDSIKNYWLEKLGLNNGAAYSIFSEMNDFRRESVNTIIAAAYEKEKDEEEKRLLQWILDLEPFLSRCTHAFNLLSDVAVKKVSDVKQDLDALVSNFPIETVLPLICKNERLETLIGFIQDNCSNGEQFAEAILNYHKKIMKDRGGEPWVTVENNSIKHYIPNNNNRISTEMVISQGYWYNGYYLNALKSIFKGLNPE